MGFGFEPAIGVQWSGLLSLSKPRFPYLCNGLHRALQGHKVRRRRLGGGSLERRALSAGWSLSATADRRGTAGTAAPLWPVLLSVEGETVTFVKVLPI